MASRDHSLYSERGQAAEDAPIKVIDWLPRLKNRERPGCRGCVPIKVRDWLLRLNSRERPGCNETERDNNSHSYHCCFCWIPLLLLLDNCYFILFSLSPFASSHVLQHSMRSSGSPHTVPCMTLVINLHPYAYTS